MQTCVADFTDRSGVATDVAPVIAVPRNRRVSAQRRPIFAAVSLLLAVFFAVAIAEIGLRLCGFGHNYTYPMGSFFEPDAELGCHGKPNFAGRFHRADFDVTVEHDENGFRRGELIDIADGREVYVLGDSFVWGYGIGQRDLLTNQMARLLGRRVHNCGLIGAGTVEEFMIFQKHVAPRLRPGDTVVLVFFGNDFGDNVGKHLRGRTYAKIDNGQVVVVPPAPTSGLRRCKNWLKDASCIFNLVTYCLDRHHDVEWTKGLPDRATRRVPSNEEVHADTDATSAAVQITRYYFAAMQETCRDKQVQLLAVLVPGQAELGEDDVTSTSDLSPQEEVTSRQAFDRLIKELGIDTVDLMAPMLAAKHIGRFERLTFAHDFHWNAAGNTVAAETIAGKLR
jgi:lysophospholipase L1-like esterase